MSFRSLTIVTIVVFITTEAVSGVDVIKSVGDQVSFRPDIFVPPVTSIIWKHRNTGGVVVKVIEWDEGDIIIPNPRFKDITTVDEKTGQINITNLKVEHSGVYIIDINCREQRQRLNLTVMERVPKPVIEVYQDNPDVVYLICKYSEKIIWKNSAGEELTGSMLHPKGESITVQKNEGNPENFYTCTLDNGASKETSDPVYERDLFEAIESSDGSGKELLGILITITIIQIIIIGIHFVQYEVNPDFVKFVEDCCPLIEGLYSPAQTKS